MRRQPQPMDPSMATGAATGYRRDHEFGLMIFMKLAGPGSWRRTPALAPAPTQAACCDQRTVRRGAALVPARPRRRAPLPRSARSRCSLRSVARR